MTEAIGCIECPPESKRPAPYDGPRCATHHKAAGGVMPRQCKDCMAIWKAKGSAGPMPKRPAPHKGPRCTTHHREAKKATKAAAHEAYAQKTYSLGPGDYDRLRELQGGRCAICRRATGATKALAVDHDHACCAGPVSCGNCVRGLLCSPCNRTLGHARDELDFFKRAHRYLKNPPARQLEVDP